MHPGARQARSNDRCWPDSSATPEAATWDKAATAQSGLDQTVTDLSGAAMDSSLHCVAPRTALLTIWMA